MKILNFGSLNIDHVYSLERFAQVGETMHSLSYDKFVGGKGLNQSIAIARAGKPVFHAGKIGSDGKILIDCLRADNINVDFVSSDKNHPSGHAIIQVTNAGDNFIILHSGSNGTITKEEVDETLSHFESGDFLVLQNEIGQMSYIMESAKKIGMTIVFNPAPMDDSVLKYPLELVDIFIVNEVEGGLLTQKTDPNEIVESAAKAFPNSRFALTLGKDGVIYKDSEHNIACPAANVGKVVDTTAAGDTFVGYLVAGLADGMKIENVLNRCMKACGICVTRKGASPTIPTVTELTE